MIYERRRFFEKQKSNEKTIEEKKRNNANHMKKYKEKVDNLLKDEYILEKDLLKQN